MSLALIQETSYGQKDARRSLFSLWKEIFQLPVIKKYLTHHSLDLFNQLYPIHRHPVNQIDMKVSRAFAEHNMAYSRGNFIDVAITNR